MKVFVAISLFIILLSGCMLQSENHSNSNQLNDDSESNELPLEHVNWLLLSGESDNEDIEYLVNIDDPDGDNVLLINELMDALQIQDANDDFNYTVYLNAISNDGSKISFIKMSHLLDHLIVVVYDLKSNKEEFRFNIPHVDSTINSPDLSQYVYMKNETIFLYDAKAKETKTLALDQHLLDSINVIHGEISPNGRKLAFQDGRSGIVIFDLVKNQIYDRIEPGQDSDVTINQWFGDDQIMYTINKTTYLSNSKQGHMGMNGKEIGVFKSTPIFSPDGTMVYYTDESNTLHHLDLNSEKKQTASTVYHRIGYTSLPQQWIKTTIDYKKYKQSVPIARISASSTLSDINGISYNAENLVDGRYNTCWCENTQGNGEGEAITIDFGELQEIRGIDIVNGLAKSKQSYKDNSRVKKLKLEFSDGSSTIVEPWFAQMVFDNNIKSTFVKITILEVESGEKYEDTCMTEIRILKK